MSSFIVEPTLKIIKPHLKIKRARHHRLLNLHQHRQCSKKWITSGRTTNAEATNSTFRLTRWGFPINFRKGGLMNLIGFWKPSSWEFCNFERLQLCWFLMREREQLKSKAIAYQTNPCILNKLSRVPVSLTSAKWLFLSDFFPRTFDKLLVLRLNSSPSCRELYSKLHSLMQWQMNRDTLPPWNADDAQQVSPRLPGWSLLPSAGWNAFCRSAVLHCTVF